MMMSTKDPYSPNPNPRKTYIGNRSSVSYNIISNEKEDINLKIPKDIDKNKINFQSISISKYFDLQSPYNMHFNRQYKKTYLENPSIFRVYKGLFSGMYDNSIRNGNIYPPFETKTTRKLNKK